MKVGILTFHNVTNYGGVLQCFALQKALLKIECDVEVIDYTNEYFKKYYSPFFVQEKNIRKFVYMIYAFRQKRNRNRKFKEFREKWLHLSERAFDKNSIAQADDIYDAIITGSDQVWNLNLTKGDENYLLPFCKKARKISYAASFGFSQMPKALEKIYERDLQGYVAMSVREESAAEMVNDLMSIKPMVQIDPVFLLTKDEWKVLLKGETRIHKEEYICVYKINESETYKLTQKLSKLTSLPVVTIKADKTCPSEFIKLREASPIDFLNAISNAKYVVTDSFHGTAFSILFEKNFISCSDKRKENRNTRIVNVLRCFQLTNRLDNYELDTLKDQSDLEKVSELVDIEREKALNFLKNALN